MIVSIVKRTIELNYIDMPHKNHDKPRTVLVRGKQSLPSVTIIILNFNGLNVTLTCLSSVLETKYSNFKIIVVDNGSDVDETKPLSRIFKDRKITWIRFKKNFGFARANNKIIKTITSKYITILNNDTKVHRDWLEELIKVAQSNTKIAVCQSKILSFYFRRYFEYAGAAGGLIDGLGYTYARGRIGLSLEEDLGQYDTISEIMWASGTAMLIKRKVLNKVGLLPEDFFAYHEETDFCWRIMDAGYKVMFVPKSVIYHKGSQSFNKILYKKIFLVHRNSLLFILRNFSFERLVWVFPLRIFLDWASCIFYLFTKKPLFIFSVIKAHFSLFLKLPSVLQYRLGKKIKGSGIVEKKLYPLSIYWEYFVKRKKRFSEIIGLSFPSKTMNYDKMRK